MPDKEGNAHLGLAPNEGGGSQPDSGGVQLPLDEALARDGSAGGRRQPSVYT